MRLPDTSFDFDRLWDADAYARGSRGPWTIFAFPVHWADERWLPRDDEARRFLAALLARGLQIGIWRHPRIDDTVYFACPYEERERVEAVVQELERAGEFAPRFAAERTEYLFSKSPGV